MSARMASLGDAGFEQLLRAADPAMSPAPATAGVEGSQGELCPAADDCGDVPTARRGALGAAESRRSSARRAQGQRARERRAHHHHADARVDDALAISSSIIVSVSQSTSPVLLPTTGAGGRTMTSANDSLARIRRADGDALRGAAVLGLDDDVWATSTSRRVSRRRRFGAVSARPAGAVRGDKVLERRQPLAEVRLMGRR